MQLSRKVSKILENYTHENPGVLKNIANILMAGKLKGTGKMVILPVDQGFEHGPARSFAVNPEAYDPLYHPKLAIDAGLNAYAAPLGMLEMAAANYPGAIPYILKMNSANSLVPSEGEPDQAMIGSVDDALRLGCSAIGFTIYPGSGNAFFMFEEVAELAREAKAKGLAVVVWSYPRGGDLTKKGETSLDVIAYAAHIAALIGANIIKVKPPAADLEQDAAKKVYDKNHADMGQLKDRIAHIMQSSFDGKRLVVFSGGGAKDEAALLTEIQELQMGGASGSIIGRNVFQRPREEALALLAQVIEIYRR